MICLAKFMLVISFAFFLTGCPSTERNAIQKIVPTRTGVGIGLIRSAHVKSVFIKRDRHTVFRQEVGMKTSSLLVDFNWERGEVYTFDVETLGGILSKKNTPFERARPFVLGKDELGEPCSGVEVAEIGEWSKKLYEDVDVSSKNMIGLAGFDQVIRVYDDSGKLVWRYKIPAGVARCVKFSPDGLYLMAGEASQDGNLYCFYADTGKLCWSYAVARDLGRSRETYYGYQPKICSIVVIGQRVYVSATRTSLSYIQVRKEETGQRRQVQGSPDTLVHKGTTLHTNTLKVKGVSRIKYWPKSGVVYAFDLKTGKLIWKFPSSGLLDTAPLRVSLDASGRYLVFGGWGGSANGLIRQKYPENRLYLLNAETGRLLWSYTVPPARKFGFGTASIGSGSSISSNGQYIACCSMDGRLFLFDIGKCLEGKIPHLIYHKAVSTPLWVGGIPIYAYGGKVFVGNEGEVLLNIGRTYIAPVGKGIAQAPDIRHPRENSVIKLDRNGIICWVWQGQGPMESPSMSRDGRYLVVAMCHNYITRSKDMGGIYCFDLKRSEKGMNGLLWFFKMEGIGIACGISPDGKYIGAIEGPIDVDPRPEYQDIRGKHRVFILS